MDVKDFDLTWEDRYILQPLRKWVKIIECLEEPLKCRKWSNIEGVRKELGEGVFRGVRDERFYDGRLLGAGTDGKGFYVIVEPNRNEIDKIKQHKITKRNIQDAYDLRSKQYRINDRGISLEEYEKLCSEINVLFTKVFSINNPELAKEKEPSYSRIFENGAFNIFLKWIENSNDEQVKSISFIFQKLKKENKLRNHNFKILSEWAFKNNYLNEESYNKLLINGCFISPSKILTKTRLALYDSIIGN